MISFMVYKGVTMCHSMRVAVNKMKDFWFVAVQSMGGASHPGLTSHIACSNIQLYQYIQVKLPGKEEKVGVIDVFLTSCASTEKMFILIT